MRNHLTCCSSSELDLEERQRIQALASSSRTQDSIFSDWASGYGVIQHDDLIQVRINLLKNSTEA